MRDFIISTDSTADLPADFVSENNITVHPLYYYVDDVQYGGANTLSNQEFYARMRNGADVRTSAINPDEAHTTFTELVQKGYDIIHISFSSGLSCTYNNAVIMANDTMEENPGSRIEVIDSLCASLGEGLFVYYAVQMKKKGKSFEEVVAWLKENRLHICHQFTVEDLKYLYKGGRISRTVAILGTLINVKPVLHVDDEGHLVPMSNVRGRKKSLNALIDNMEAQFGTFREKNECVFIGHSDCLEDAQYVAEKVKERFGLDAKIIDYIAPIIGSHSGPGTLALFHLGESRMIGA